MALEFSQRKLYGLPGLHEGQAFVVATCTVLSNTWMSAGFFSWRAAAMAVSTSSLAVLRLRMVTALQVTCWKHLHVCCSIRACT